jgi:hypothetical protein
MKNWFKNHLLKLAAIIMSLGALANFPYAYFQLMNWVVTIASIQIIYQAHRQDRIFLVWLFGFTAIVFNPLAPLYLRADIWQGVDILAAALFVISVFLFRDRPLKSPPIL